MDTAIVALLSIIALCQILLLVVIFPAIKGKAGSGVSWPTLPFTKPSGLAPGVYVGDEEGPEREELQERMAIPNDMMKNYTLTKEDLDNELQNLGIAKT